MGKLVALLAFLGGCSAGAVSVQSTAGRADDAMAIVWEQSYGMEVASRPRVEWFTDACRTETGADLKQIASTTYLHGCIVQIVHSDGRVELKQEAAVSASRFAAALRQWKQWLLVTDMNPHWDHAEVDAANAALELNGL